MCNCDANFREFMQEPGRNSRENEITCNFNYFLDINMAIIVAMLNVSIAKLKNQLSAYLNEVRKGKTFQVKNRNQVVALLTPLPMKIKNKTRLGIAKSSGKILEDLTQPCIPESDWHMLDENEDYEISS